MSVPEQRHLPDDRLSGDSIDIRAALASRPYRIPNYEAEDRALALLAVELAENPQNMLQLLAEVALELCHADTAGVSLLETHGNVEVFRWEALAGVFARLRNNTMPRKASPCGVCIDEDATQLMFLPERRFPELRTEPRFVEALLIPFRCEGQPVGTIWVVMHQFERRFDGEDERLMRTLAAFASAGWQLQRAQAQLRNFPALLVQAQETERRLLARELHDDLTQKLAALGMEANALGNRELGHKIGGLADDIHRISHQLHPAILDDLGLEAALRDECTSFSQRFGIAVRFHSESVPRSLPSEVALCLFRVAQESLRNIAKHAHASEVRVRLERGRTGISLFVGDSGAGFDVSQARGKGGLGLISMEERIQLVKGYYRIHSRPGVGTEKEFHVPLEETGS